uniref:Uncharacterized protein n=1 Tax=Anguilla anguilla TaxID=7936 RepID=A0A0E9UQR8_ANGAN
MLDTRDLMVFLCEFHHSTTYTY